jgi:hypothetical protein
VFHVDQYLPIYYEISAQVAYVKPTAGWKANAFVIFDYYGPNDFKFAGVDQSRNKLQMGQRTPDGWIVLAEGNLRSFPDTFYDVLVAVNGTQVTVVVDGTHSFSHTFDPRVIEGVSYGLNTGMVGVGSDNARGYFNNVVVQALPPQITLDHIEDFSTGDPGVLTVDAAGTWQIQTEVSGAARFEGIPDPDGDVGMRLVDLGIDRGLAHNAYLELHAAFRTDGWGGFVFDQYATTDVKFVALDVPGQRVVVGYWSPRGGLTVAEAIPWTLTPGADHHLRIDLRGSAVNVLVDGQMVTTYSYNSAIVPGGFGLLTRGGTTSYDMVRIQTNDRAFDGEATPVTVSVGGVTVPAGAGSVVVEVPVELSREADGTVTVDVETVAGTAVAGVHYDHVSGTLTFEAGQLQQVVEVTVHRDAIDGEDLSFHVRLSDADGADVGVGLATVTLLAPTPPVVTVTAPRSTATAEEPGVFVVARDGDTGGSLEIGLDWSGQAIFGDDYAVTVIGGTLDATGTTLTLDAGMAEATLEVHPTQAASGEVLLTVLDGDGYGLGDPSSSTVTIVRETTMAMTGTGRNPRCRSCRSPMRPHRLAATPGSP